MNKMEIQYIKEAREQNRCFNVSKGGSNEENMKLLSELNKRLNTGKKATEETKRKMSNAKKGRPANREGIERGLQTRAEFFLSGNMNAHTKISAKEAEEIKKMLMNEVPYKEISEKYGISKSNINAIRSNRSWTFVKVDGWDEFCKTHRVRNKSK